MPAYRFVGPEPAPYPWGMVEPGAVGVFPHRAPDASWVEVVEDDAPLPEPEETVPPELVVPENRPPKASDAATWTAFAIEDGQFQAATGVHPNSATRKAIVEFYYPGEVSE